MREGDIFRGVFPSIFPVLSTLGTPADIYIGSLITEEYLQSERHVGALDYVARLFGRVRVQDPVHAREGEYSTGISMTSVSWFPSD